MMEKVVLDVPLLWADHHVLKVRQVLTQLDGVEDVYASSAWKQVLVKYDPAKVTWEVLEQVLAQAGYPVGQGEIPLLVLPTDRRRDPRWSDLGFRMAQTYRADVEMSGDFRKW
ncbi:MAG: heavy-metal-associated domain-containing protein [Anaerolineae bacterium]